MDVSKNRGTPKWMVKIMENPIKMGDLGGFPPIFGNTHIAISTALPKMVSNPISRSRFQATKVDCSWSGDCPLDPPWEQGNDGKAHQPSFPHTHKKKTGVTYGSQKVVIMTIEGSNVSPCGSKLLPLKDFMFWIDNIFLTAP